MMETEKLTTAPTAAKIEVLIKSSVLMLQKMQRNVPPIVPAAVPVSMEIVPCMFKN